MIGPDATVTLDFALARLAAIIDKLVVYPATMQKNLDRLGGLIHSQRVMIALTQKGVAREDAYRLVQRNAMKVWSGESAISCRCSRPTRTCARSSPTRSSRPISTSTIISSTSTRSSSGCLARPKSSRRAWRKLRPFLFSIPALAVSRCFARSRAARPDARFVYVADDAGFPYGESRRTRLIARVVEVLGNAIAEHKPDLVVVACNTASTLALAELRARFAVPFVGTVPAIKPACAQSASKRIAVLGTQATVGREYTRALIREFADGCDCASCRLVAARDLCRSRACRRSAKPTPRSPAEIAACFVENAGNRTDTIVLACTHYPLLLHRFRVNAPWPVTWLDPAPAIARRVADLWRPHGEQPSPPPRISFTSGRAPASALATALGGYGF